MATQNLIQIKRSTGNTAPPTLANGELAWSSNGSILYIGDLGSVVAVGGVRNPGVLTANQALVANATGYLDVVRTANLFIGSASVNVINAVANSTVIGSGSNNELTTTWAIKTFVESRVGGATDLDGLSDVSISSPANNQFLVYDGVNSVWENHSISGTTNEVEISTSDNNLTIGLPDDVTVTTSLTVGSAAIKANNGITANSTGLFVTQGVGTTVNSTGVHVRANNGITSNSTGVFVRANSGLTVNATGLYVTQGSGAVVNSSGVHVNANNGLVSNSTGVFVLAGTGVVSNSTGVHIGQAVGTSDDVTFRDVVVSGNLTINGTTTTVDTATLTVEDPLIQLARLNSSADSVDIGFYGLYDTSGSLDLYAGLFRDASDGKFKLFRDLQAAPTTTVDTAGAGYTVGTLVAALESSDVTITGGSITGITDLAVADGGTGRSSFTNNAILYGNTAGPISMVTGSAYGVLSLDASGVPMIGGLDGGTF